MKTSYEEAVSDIAAAFSPLAAQACFNFVPFLRVELIFFGKRLWSQFEVKDSKNKIVRSYIKRLARDDFWRHNAIFFVGSMAVSVLNYLYYPVLGRMLDLHDFGEVQALVSLFLQAIIFFGVLGLVTVNIVANQGNDETKNRIIYELEKLALMVTLVVLAGSLLLAGEIKSWFRFDSIYPFLVLALSLVVSVPLTFRLSYVRGKSDFKSAAWSGVWAAGAKLVGSAGLVYVGLRTLGAIAGLVAAQAVALVYTAAKARQLGFRPERQHRQARLPDLKVLKPELKYAGFVLVVTLIMTFQFSLDILVVKHYFAADIAGLYAGITTIARIIYFLTGSIGLVLMSSVQIEDLTKSNAKVFVRSAVLVVGLGGLALAAFVAAPGLMIKILIGPKYLAFAALLPRLGLAMLITSAVNLIVTYYMALRRYSVAGPVVVGGAVTYGWLVWHHLSPSAVVGSLLGGSLAMLGLLAVWRVLRSV